MFKKGLNSMWVACLATMMMSGCGAVDVTETPVDVPAEPTPPAAPAPFEGDGQHRYSRAVVPTAYRVALTVDPRTAQFSGQTEIDVVIGALDDGLVVLHGQDMKILVASIRTATGTAEAEVETGPNGALALRVTPPPAPGPATLYLAYEAPLPQITEGLYRVQDGERWYAFTQFEPLEARKAFPCFDQPEFKTPFTFRVTVPRGMTALTNTPEISRADAGESTVFEFAESKPLPTYLVAFAIGELNLVTAAPGAFPGGLTFRVATVQGRPAALTDYVIKTSPPILAALSDYFGQPYPYQKLDYVAVPNFGAGAMENVGLVTYREPLILLDAEATPRARRASLSVNAHELAHMWFGNLVTPQWWDDLWLNEAFATWMASKIVDVIAPEFEETVDSIGGTQWAMGLDTQADARAVRQPITEAGDIYNAFDGITYTKGRAILAMTEAWIGEDAFRQGVRDYMKAKAHGVATGHDLFNALGAASGQAVREMLSTFTDQPGVPLIDVRTECGDARFGRAKVTLKQTRFLPKGSKADASTQWRIPICLRYSIANKVHRECIELTGAERVIELGGDGCPDWLHPNADEQGYYRWRIPTGALTALATAYREKLSLPERVALPGHLRALYEAGGLDVTTFLDTLKALAADPHPLVTESIIWSLSLIENSSLSEAGVAPFGKMVRGIGRPLLKRIGRKPKKNEAPQIRMLRPALIRLLAGPGLDKKAMNHAKTMAKRFFKSESSISADERSYALQVAAWEGDEALWENMRKAFDRASTPAIRSDVLSALASFRAPSQLEKTLGLLLDGTLRAQDVRSVTRRATGHRMTRHLVWEWMVRHYDPILELMGDKYASRFPRLATGFCAPGQRAEVVAFFEADAHRPSGTERNLGLALERIDRCIRLRNDTEAALDAYLKVKR